ncbi:hypothetical protein GQ53DRAFT_828235 [Thozetella sp. PMI_491]|nr:hypothetical protein GQ53DRAFT_828235 [Thozetella sp. PMI_491]
MVQGEDLTKRFTKRICEPVPSSYYEVEPISGSWTLHRILTVIAGPLTALVAIVILGLAAMHLRTYTNPPAQRQLVRVILVPLSFAGFSFFSLWFYDAAEYLIPLADLYECFALVSFFYYMIVLVTPDEEYRLMFFHNLEKKGSKGRIISGGSLKWLAKRWWMVFQILPGRVIATIATWIVVARFCPTHRSYKAALTIIEVLNGIQTAICLVGMLQTYVRLKAYLTGTGFAIKFFTLKGVVFIQVVQRILVTSLVSNDVIRPSTYVSHADWSHGIPEFITVGEMVIFALVFLGPYSWKPFKFQKLEDPGAVRLPVGRALLNALNLGDILKGIVYPFEIYQLEKQMRVATAQYETLPLQEQQTTFNR